MVTIAIADEDDIDDHSDFTDHLLRDPKRTMSTVELRVPRVRLIGGQRSKVATADDVFRQARVDPDLVQRKPTVDGSWGSPRFVNVVHVVIINRNPRILPLHHSDLGTRYTSIALSERLEQLGMRVSMGSRGGRAGHHRDRELACHTEHRTARSAALANSRRVEDGRLPLDRVIYKRQRLHSGLGYLTPEACGRRYAEQGAVAGSTRNTKSPRQGGRLQRQES